MKIKNFKLITIFFVLFLTPSFIFAIDTELDGWRIPKDGQKEINVSYAHLIVKNFCSQDVFIPTRDKTEFDYFIANRPNCLERWKCNEYVYELNSEIVCAPSSSIFLTWETRIDISKNTISMTYCSLDDSRTVSTPIAPVDYGAIVEALKADIVDRLAQANADITSLQTDFDNAVLTDDGIPLKLNSARELALNIQTSYDNADYNLAVQLLDELELLIISVPFEGTSVLEVKLEAEANLPRFDARYAEFKTNYSDVSEFPSYIRDKFDDLEVIYNKVHSDYTSGQNNYIPDNETSRTNFISCLNNIDSGNLLITEITTDIENTNLAKINEAKNEKALAQAEVDKIINYYPILNTHLTNCQDDIDSAEYYYSIGWVNTAYRKAKDAIKDSDKVVPEIQSIATIRITEAENKLSNLWTLYNDENLNETWIENKLDDCQIEIDNAQTLYDISSYPETINAIDGPTFTLLNEVETDINDQI